MHAEENLLGHLYAPGSAGGHGPAVVVGAGGDHSDRCAELVDRVPERLVLDCVSRKKANLPFEEPIFLKHGWTRPSMLPVFFSG